MQKEGNAQAMKFEIVGVPDFMQNDLNELQSVNTNNKSLQG